ncbi:sigma 54-interacting transcriptional regulator [Leisingera sp. ANG59]|uniref:sigma 54-interacting transcriptional regulator n=1 Tax=Leisingera sp. ANG59 TaxID=2675221 RepID=UPI001574965D|nr:sigma 54-interacting transcriptional regulator [Leisingera sp. ANG59]NSY40338.1 PAS domain S-box protein [Leisingera sp. ANG59]
MKRESDILDMLPFGVLRLQGERITYANRMLRSLFDGGLTTLSELADRYPELEDLRRRDGAEQAPAWITINASVFCVASVRRDTAVEHYFLPSWFVSATDEGLKALQDNFDDFAEIFENCFDGIYVADGAGRTLWMNAGFERCYGLSARNFLGRDASMLEREGYLDPLITWKIISTKKRQTALQTTKSGRKVLATGIPLMAPDGTVRRVIINSRDTTELIEMQGKLTAAEQEIRNYESELREIRENAAQDGELFWASEDMQETVRLAMRVARTDAAVLISGPSGVGKRKLSDLIFRYSKRSRKRLLRFGFGGLPEAAVMEELFGKEAAEAGRDEGLLARAVGGTMILERVDLMPPRVQERLSSWLRTGKSRPGREGRDLRLIATSRGDLSAMVNAGKFREDLYYRLAVAEICIPPLQDRVADIAGLAQHFLEAFNKLHDAEKYFDRAAINRLARWTWPGNVRELRTMVERMVVTGEEARISAAMVEDAFAGATNPVIPQGGMSGRVPAEEVRDRVRAFEADLLHDQVARAGSIQKAADATGISVSTIKRKLAWRKVSVAAGTKLSE